MALALNNLKRVDMPLNKETKPNLILTNINDSYFDAIFLWMYRHVYTFTYNYIYIYIYRERERESVWTTSHERAKAGCPAWTYIQQLSADTGCSSVDLPKVMDDREVWQERVRDICSDSMTWWWWRYIYIERERRRDNTKIYIIYLF